MPTDKINGLLKTNLKTIKKKYSDFNGNLKFPVYEVTKLNLKDTEAQTFHELKQYVENNQLENKPLYIKFSEKYLMKSDIADVAESEKEFFKKIEETQKLSPHEQVKKIKETGDELENLLKTTRENEEAVSVSLKASENTFLMTKAALENFYKEAENQEEKETEILRRDNQIPKISSQSKRIINIINNSLSTKTHAMKSLNVLKDYKEGNTLAHLSRVFLHTTKFLSYLKFNLNRDLIKKIIPLFSPKERYGVFYQIPWNNFLQQKLRLLSNIDIITMSQAALFHDIGKLPYINYFEGNQKYKRDIIELHAIRGYTLLMNSKEFSQDIAHVAGAHHEYNGHQDGYGVCRDIYKEKQKLSKQEAIFYFSTNIHDVISGKAKYHLYTSLISIIDVFDALMCTKRKYRTISYSENEALKIINDMVHKEKKLDAFLFDLFLDYIKSDYAKTNSFNEFHNHLLFKQKNKFI